MEEIKTQEDLHKYFEGFCNKMIDVMKAKSHDYNGATDPFANFKIVEQNGIASVEQGFLTRMTDKMSRLATFVRKGEYKVNDEKVEDTLLDLANYSILMSAYIKSKK